MKRRLLRAIPMLVMFVMFAAASNRHAARNRSCAIPLQGATVHCEPDKTSPIADPETCCLGKCAPDASESAAARQ